MGTVLAEHDVTLADCYDKYGTIVINGNQAIVRLLIEQKKRDEKAGLATGGYVSGYRGSPLGGLDSELWRQESRLDEANIRFHAGLNEDLAATAIWGTQQLNYTDRRTVDGVFSLWYGKGPGVDRSGDVIKHGNYAGASSTGGVVMVFGDDHPGKSSSIANQSDHTLIAAQIPIFFPSNVREIIDFGLEAFSLSRYASVWTSLKLVNETAETSAVIDLPQPSEHDLGQKADNFNFEPVARYDPLGEEIDLVSNRLPRVAEFAAKSSVDRIALGRSGAKFGVVTAGKAYNDVIDALRFLRLTEDDAAALGIAVYKVGLIYPLDSSGLCNFARGCSELLFVEEKRAVLEPQAATILYHLDGRPRIVGKADPDEPLHSLFPTAESLDGHIVARALLKRLTAHGITHPTFEDARSALENVTKLPDLEIKRLPHFCSGCPHSTSTKVPEGSMAFSGIGCHGMASWIDSQTLKGVHMGGEGANWIGMSLFSEQKHVFQNMGDGTFAHSGLLAIRAAVHSGVNITYKILANGAVAMTGGQPIEGEIAPFDIVRQVMAENVKRCVIVTDDVDRFGANAPVEVLHRSELSNVQRKFRDTPGTTVIVYDQMCATEKRRMRKRGTLPVPTTHVVINESVCEGCGDCSVQSNCLSIVPIDTPFGSKRAIDHETCNVDLSCLKGFCPSFVTVTGGHLRKPEKPEMGSFSSVHEVEVKELDDGFNVLITGVGGGGIVTMGAIIVTAARIAGLNASTYNMTGLAQKGGAVLCHVRLFPPNKAASAGRIPPGAANLLLASDLVTAMGEEALSASSPLQTKLIGDTLVQPTAAIINDPNLNFVADPMIDRLKKAVVEVETVSASNLSMKLLGDKLGVNMFLVGYAYQKGDLPIPLYALRKAIELNGAAVPMNLNALELGRVSAQDPSALKLNDKSIAVKTQTLQALIASRVEHLELYQDAAWSRRYRQIIEKIAMREKEVVPGREELTRAAATYLAKLMSYKDEYEVARLYSTDAWKAFLSKTFAEPGNRQAHLSPPFISKIDLATGRPAKRVIGQWIFSVYPILAKFKFLRGTVFDPFGRTTERRVERDLITRYCATLDEIRNGLCVSNYHQAVVLASVPDQVRGYGPVKEQFIKMADVEWSSALANFRTADAGKHQERA